MFKALILNQDADGQVKASIERVSPSLLSTALLPKDSDVFVDIKFAGLNYKDGLCLSGKGQLINEYPRIPGIDFAGVVTQSHDPRYQKGDQVIATGWRIGEVWHGGYAEKACVKADWLVPLPKGLDLRQAMIFGTAGLTAMLGVDALEEHGLRPDNGYVLVTGAAGGVGSFAVSLLTSLGYQVAAVTGRITEAGDYLASLGACKLMARDELATTSSRPLEKQRWAGCIDAVGGEMLARILGQLCYGGAVAAIGNTGGIIAPVNIIPFLLRGVNILGIDSVHQPYQKRVACWARLANNFPLAHLDMICSEIRLEDVEQAGRDILAGKIQGRIIVKL